MKIDLKKLIKKILDHRRGPKIFVAVFTILLSCISFGYCADYQYTFNWQGPLYNEYYDTSDSFICIDFNEISQYTIERFRIEGDYSNLLIDFGYNIQGQQIYNGSNLICTFVPLQNRVIIPNLQFQGYVQPTITFYQYVYSLAVPPQQSMFTVRLADLGNNTINDLQFYLSPGSTDMYKVSYASSVNASFGQNSVSFSSNVSCSSCESSLASCQSDFTQCYSGYQSLLSDYSSCSSSLSSCQSDLNSASGYVSSLESELNQCTSDLINCSNSSNTGSCETGSNWSALYINDIQHLGKPNIFITIPEEIAWNYTSEGDDFDLNVSGYNVDTEYIENVIDIQNTKPSQDDFNKIISEVIPLFVPGLFIILFIYFVFRLVKKVF